MRPARLLAPPASSPAALHQYLSVAAVNRRFIRSLQLSVRDAMNSFTAVVFPAVGADRRSRLSRLRGCRCARVFRPIAPDCERAIVARARKNRFPDLDSSWPSAGGCAESHRGLAVVVTARWLMSATPLFVPAIPYAVGLVAAAHHGRERGDPMDVGLRGLLTWVQISCSSLPTAEL